MTIFLADLTYGSGGFYRESFVNLLSNPRSLAKSNIVLCKFSGVLVSFSSGSWEGTCFIYLNNLPRFASFILFEPIGLILSEL